MPRRGEPSPIIRPVTLVLDGAAWPGLGTLRKACGELGVHVQYVRQFPAVRRTMGRSLERAASLFTDYLLSPAGRVAHAAGWPQEMLQELLDTWAMRVWPHAEVPSRRGRGTRNGLPRHGTQP